MSTASNHTKLVWRGDNLNNKTLMYIPYVSSNYRLSGMFTFKKGPEVGYNPTTDWIRLLWAGVRPTTKWWSRPPSGVNPNSRVRLPSERNPSSGVRLTIAFEWGPHQWRYELGMDGCDLSTDWMRLLWVGVGPAVEWRSGLDLIRP